MMILGNQGKMCTLTFRRQNNYSISVIHITMLQGEISININSKCYRIYYYSSNNKYDIIYYQIIKRFWEWMAHFSLGIFSTTSRGREGTGRDSLSIFHHYLQIFQICGEIRAKKEGKMGRRRNGRRERKKEKRNYSANKKCAYMLSSFSHV